ncbi:MAG TPA: hypothetical protein VNX02_11485 [Steroidobacteraceae bacterium]|jgi:hypothetical protein|nr:hypothetical protein [Steroidobacteraceae bacterium]
MPLTQNQLNFHMEEYRQLRAEVASLLARIETLLRYSLVASAAVYAWLIAQSVGFVVDASGQSYSCLRLPHELLIYGWWIPPAFVVLAGLGAGVTRWRVREMSEYLSQLEKETGLVPPLGWEAFLKGKPSTMTATTVGVWLLVLFATGAASMKGTCVTERAAHMACPAKAP